MIRSLNEHLGIPADVLIRGNPIPTDFADLEWEKFPLREMQKRGWISQITDLVDNAEELVRGMIDRAGGCSALAALYRKNDCSRKNANVNPYALKAWCLYVMAKGREANLSGDYIRGSINLSFLTTVVSGFSKAKARLDARMREILGDKFQDWRTHDLRRTAASGMAALGFQPHVIERVLNHVSGAQGGLVGVYQRHEYRQERRHAIMAWDDKVMQIVGNAEQQASNVVAMRTLRIGSTFPIM